MMKEKTMKLLGKVKLGAKRNAPELLLGGALITGTATVILIGRASIKAKELADQRAVDKAAMAYKLSKDGYSEEEIEIEIRKTFASYALSLAKEYAVPVALYAATVGMIFGSYKIQKNRQVALSAALASCTAAYKTLVNKLQTGAAAGLTAQEVLDGIEAKQHVDPETGEITFEKVVGDSIDTSVYKVRFDEYSTVWEKDKFVNEMTLKCEENWANDKLRLQGYLFLNDVYDRLGLPRTKTGQIVGWLAEGDGDGYVDFGVFDCEGYEDIRYNRNAFDLNFNVDGDILSKFGKGAE